MSVKQKEAKKESKFLFITGIIFCIIFGVMLICNLVIIVKGTLHPEMPPSVFGTTPMVVLSGSMSGTAKDHIEVGDLIFVDKASPDSLKKGDVIAFMEGEVVVTHRITDITKDENGKLLFTTKGDANNSKDQNPVSEDNLVGIYKSRIPKVGDFALFLQTPLGMVIFIGVPLSALFIYDIMRRRRLENKEKDKTAKMEEELNRLRKLAGEDNDAD